MPGIEREIAEVVFEAIDDVGKVQADKDDGGIAMVVPS